MAQLRHEIRNQVAWVTFDSGGMNTLSQAAVDRRRRRSSPRSPRRTPPTPLAGVILKGNSFGLGAGANIGELMCGRSRRSSAQYIDVGHELLYAIEESPVPWLAVVDGFALGGIYELALACRAIVATEKSTLGFPEIRLNIFPGLGGTQRMPRRSGLVNPQDPVGGDAGFTAILTGKNFRAADAAAIRMIDAVVPAGRRRRRVRRALPARDAADGLHRDAAGRSRRTPRALKPMVLPMIERATMGRPNPRAPYVALDVMVKGAALPLREAIKVERDAFLDVATSSEGKAGMRFFFTQQAVQQPPEGLPRQAARAQARRRRRRRRLHGQRDRVARARSGLRGGGARADREVRPRREGEAHGEVRPRPQEGRHEPGRSRGEARPREGHDRREGLFRAATS